MLEQSAGTTAIISWDFKKKNIVRELFGLSQNPRILFDFYGNPYVLNNNFLTMLNLRSSFLCYDTEDYGEDNHLT